MSKGLLLVLFDSTPARQDEFDDWYDLEHVPERLAVPGILNAKRWISEDNPKHAIAAYDLEAHAVMESPAYKAVAAGHFSPWTQRVTSIAKRVYRFEGSQVLPGDVVAPEDAPAMLAVTMNVDPAVEDEFNEWYKTEHLPQLAAVPGVITARRFKAAGQIIERGYAALYHMTSTDVANSEAWKKAADTPWTRKMRPHFRDLSVLRCNRYVRKA